MNIFELAFAKKLGGGSGSGGSDTEEIAKLIGRTETNYVIPEGITNIGTYAFGEYQTLKTITIPEGITSIERNAFYQCRGLEEIHFNATSMNDLAINIPIFTYAGRNVSGTKLIIGKNVTKIPAYLLYDDGHNITSIEFEDGSACESIGTYAFSNKASSSSSYGLGFVKSITIPEGITSIGAYAFSSLIGLEEIHFNATAMEGTANSNIFLDAGKNGNGVKIVIGKNVTKIPRDLCASGSASRAPKITSIAFEEGSVCASIGIWAFRYCDDIISIVIPDSVTTIENGAFEKCTSLKSVTFGKGITKIGSSFPSCTSMEVYDFTACTAIPTLSWADAFSDIPSTCQIKVPASLYDAWIAATNWSNYASNIVAV